ncbi:GntR family transcriptional regulator [Pullulanibacillus camelliae]|uniref:GntR family transcriptional regulator n=1 Tax=Pullulanibacillus camelliae TaxID=1707096 RepID=A0A8J2VN86_9BACL|nr:FadR/GntR family transcriptional regulator [Pullulanibacillus camelliae]GGE34887.1 GntR family transcriptional regulator [Pullulanibacillus camelliae]
MTHSSSFSKVTGRKLTDEIIEQLKQKIFSGAYKVGDRLPPEPQLMEEFAVGRSTLREAIKVLVHAGILEVKQGRGTRILSLEWANEASFDHQLQHADSHDVYEARTMLDREVARLAAERRTEADLLSIKSFLDQRFRALQEGNYTTYIQADIDFHLAIAKASGNQVLYDLYKAFTPILRTILSSLVLNTTHYSDNTDIHEGLFQALLAQDEEAAVQYVNKNLER